MSREQDTFAKDDARNYVQVKLTSDVGEVYGVDQQVYHLEKGGVYQIPLRNANLLFQAGVAYPVSSASSGWG